MNILLIKTDQPEANLYLYSDNILLSELKWQADRRLAETLNAQIESLLAKVRIQLKEVEAIAIYAGPGSFTGLRISHSVANALAYSLAIPIVGTSGDDWVGVAIERLTAGENDKIALPLYGSPARTTKPRK